MCELYVARIKEVLKHGFDEIHHAPSNLSPSKVASLSSVPAPSPGSSSTTTFSQHINQYSSTDEEPITQITSTNQELYVKPSTWQESEDDNPNQVNTPSLALYSLASTLSSSPTRPRSTSVGCNSSLPQYSPPIMFCRHSSINSISDVFSLQLITSQSFPNKIPTIIASISSFSSRESVFNKPWKLVS